MKKLTAVLLPVAITASAAAIVPLAATASVAGLLYAMRHNAGRFRKGQVVVVTGGSSGLGLALAHRFGKAGARLVLAAPHKEELAKAREELLSSGSIAGDEDLLLVTCDVSWPDQAGHLIEATLRTFGDLDILINNAGIIEVGPAENQPLAAYQRAMAVNFFGALHTIYAAMPHFLGKRSGAVVNISSVGGKVAVPHLLPYVVSKFALTGFSEGLHAELRQKGIRVTTVCPGLMRSGGEAHADFRGQIEKEKRWFQWSARNPILAANVNHAAKRIFSAVNAGRAEITISPQAWLAARVAGLAPETTQLLSSYVNSLVLPKPLPM